MLDGLRQGLVSTSCCWLCRPGLGSSKDNPGDNDCSLKRNLNDRPSAVITGPARQTR
jgi:hypothetical protein